MKNIIYAISLLMILSTSANAGFWSSVAGGVVANSLSGSGNSNKNNIDAKSDEKKIQQVLTKLGYYNTKIDGNLNSFETREGIEEFQKHYFIEETGILTEKQKQDFLYIHDLFKNFKQEYKNPKQQDSHKLNRLYKAFDKIENKLFKNAKSKIDKYSYISTKLKRDITARRDAIKAKRLKLQAEKREKEQILSKGKQWIEKSKFTQYGIFTDYDAKLLWQDKNIRTSSWGNANLTCKDLTIGGITNWRLPTKNELNSLYKFKTILKYRSQWSDRYSYWTSNDSYNKAWVVNFNNGDNETIGKGYNAYAARCVTSINKDLEDLINANEAMKNGNLKEAFNLYLSCAKNGNKNAQIKLAELYTDKKANKQGIKLDYKKSIYWFTKASKDGDWYCEYMLGMYSKLGLGTKKDLKKAKKWFKISLKNAKTNKQINLSKKELKNISKENRIKANNINKNNLLKANKLDKQKKYKDAFKLYSLCAKNNTYEAQEKIADYYNFGRGVKKNKTKSVKWYKKAIKHKKANYWPYYKLSLAYTNGDGVKKDLFKAETLMIKSNKLAKKWSKAAVKQTEEMLVNIRILKKDYLKYKKCFDKVDRIGKKFRELQLKKGKSEESIRKYLKKRKQRCRDK